MAAPDEMQPEGRAVAGETAAPVDPAAIPPPPPPLPTVIRGTNLPSLSSLDAESDAAPGVLGAVVAGPELLQLDAPQGAPPEQRDVVTRVVLPAAGPTAPKVLAAEPIARLASETQQPIDLLTVFAAAFVSLLAAAHIARKALSSGR